MLNKFNTLSLSFLFLMFVLAWATTTAFAAETTIYNPSFVMTANGDSIVETVTDSGGNPATIVAECVATRGETFTWYVKYIGVVINCGFTVDVKNNQIKKAYDPWITTFGCYYENDSLYWNSKYAELSFKAVAYLNLGASSCYLRATVTGSNNQIKLTGRF